LLEEEMRLSFEEFILSLQEKLQPEFENWF